MKISKRARSIIGLVSIIVIVAMAILWNTVLRQQITSVQVVVLRTAVMPGERIEAGNLVMRAISRTDLIQGAILAHGDAARLTQYEARQYIPAGTQLVEEYFDTPNLVLSDNEYIFSVPNEWVIAVPATLRRRDTVVFYAISSSKNKGVTGYDILLPILPSASTQPPQPTSMIIEEATAIPAATGGATSASATATPSATPAPQPTAGASVAAAISSDIAQESEKANLQAMKDGQKYQIRTVVAYVKDKSGREVVTSNADASGKLQRMDGSGNIDHVEIVATQEQMDTLQFAVLQGYKFVVLYQ